MLRLDKLRITLLILVASSISLCANIFFKTYLTPKVVSVKADPSARIEASESLSAKMSSSRTGSSNGTQANKTAMDSDVIISVRSNNSNKAIDPNSITINKINNSTTNKTNYSLVDASTGRTISTFVESDGVKWCPDIPPFLEGPLAVMSEQVNPIELMAWYPTFESGGRLQPKDCVPRQRLAIIIPYRGRYSHLHIMMNNIVPLLQRQQADVTFFVIEQALPETFNRGALLNIGFLEANKLGHFDCFIFHDADLIPVNDRNIYRCGDNPRHFAVGINKFGYKLVYRGYFGGVVGFTKQQFLTVNGCSNLYFGWGGEDDDLLVRLRNKNYTMIRYDTTTARYDMLKHKRDKGNEANPFSFALLSDASKRQDLEGLNTTRYKVNSIRIERLYTWINISLNVTEILQTAPDLTIHLMKGAVGKRKTVSEQRSRKKKSIGKEAAQFKAQLSLIISLFTPKSFSKLFSP